VNFTRRDVLVGSAALIAGVCVSGPFFLPKYHVDRRHKQSRVAILHAEHYSQKLDEILAAGLRLFPIDVHGKRVILKPNLVDYAPGDAINTHPMLVLAAAESLRRMTASPHFSRGGRQSVKIARRKSGKRPLFSWHNCVVQT